MMAHRLKPGAEDVLRKFASELISGEDTDRRCPPVPDLSVDHVNIETHRIIRRSELKRLVPLSATTIYELERKGEFPRRFYLTPRCVVWSLEEVLGWIETRKNETDRSKVCHPDVTERRYRPVTSSRP